MRIRDQAGGVRAPMPAHAPGTKPAATVTRLPRHRKRPRRLTLARLWHPLVAAAVLLQGAQLGMHFFGKALGVLDTVIPVLSVIVTVSFILTVARKVDRQRDHVAGLTDNLSRAMRYAGHEPPPGQGRRLHDTKAGLAG